MRAEEEEDMERVVTHLTSHISSSHGSRLQGNKGKLKIKEIKSQFNFSQSSQSFSLLLDFHFRLLVRRLLFLHNLIPL